MSFTFDLERFAAKVNLAVDTVIRKTVLDIGTRLVMRSPVGDATLWKSPPPPGYVGGRFRANWQYGFDKIPAGDLPTIDKSGNASIQRINVGALGSPSVGVHYIVNNLPYAKALEDGHSTQAPTGMVVLTVQEFQNVVRGALQS
jgi:hypothetical protein